MPETSTRSVELLGDSIAYEVRRSDDATEPRIDVDIRGVRVVLPATSSNDPEELLAENAAWVVEKHQKYERYRAQVPDRRFEEGETVPYLDEPHEIVVERRPTSVVATGEFRLDRHHVQQTSVKRALETLYRRKARDRFEQRANHYAAEMGVEYEEIEIRNQRTKWGSCSTSGTLGLNWRLMMAPPDVIDSVIVHELAHLREQNHTQRFSNIVEAHDPDYDQHFEWLDENSARLIFCHEDL